MSLNFIKVGVFNGMDLYATETSNGTYSIVYDFEEYKIWSATYKSFPGAESIWLIDCATSFEEAIEVCEKHFRCGRN